MQHHGPHVHHLVTLAEVPEPISNRRLAGKRTVIGGLLVLAGGASVFPVAAPPASGAAFGDSTWVAPYAEMAEASAPDSAGPRVAAPDHTRFSESALRFPFRVIAFPFRLVGLGMEEAAGAIGTRQVRGQRSSKPYRLLPYFDWAEQAGPEFGTLISFGPGRERPHATATSPVAGGKSAWHRKREAERRASEVPLVTAPEPPTLAPGATVDVGWSLNNQRHAGIDAALMNTNARFGLGSSADYRFQPNLLFTGIGNVDGDQRSVYLAEEGQGEAYAWLGGNPRARLRLRAGVSSISQRSGHDDEASIEEVFTPADQVPFLGDGTTVFRYGASGVLGRVDHPDPPTSGIEGRAGVWRVHDVDGSDLAYTEWSGEARAYVPVFARRRVLALRGYYTAVHPDAESAAIPFYRLPETTGDTRFLAFESGRFRDEHLAIAQVEYRWWLWEWLWAVGYGQLGWVAPTASDLRFDAVHESYGGGIRASVTPNLLYRLDIAHGSEGTETDFSFGVQF